MALCRVHTCVSSRLAGEIVAGENRFAQFCNAILACSAEGSTRKIRLLCEKFISGPRSATVYETSPTEVTM